MKLLVWGINERMMETIQAIPDERLEVIAFISEGVQPGDSFRARPLLSPESAIRQYSPSTYDFLFIFSEKYHVDIRNRAAELGFPKEKIAGTVAFHLLPYFSSMSDEQFFAITSVPFWYHKFEILPGVMTPGISKYKPWLLAHPSVQDLSDKRVLDIGAWDGPYTLEMSRRGAKVTAFDIQPPDCSGFNIMRSLTGCQCKHICENVYKLCPELHGTYDLVTFFGVYYHLKNPLLAFENINRVLKENGMLLVEGAILEGAPVVDEKWKKQADFIKNLSSYPFALYVKDRYQREPSNWWIPSMCCLKDMLESCGFLIEHSEYTQNNTRGYCIARKAAELPLEHIILTR